MKKHALDLVVGHFTKVPSFGAIGKNVQMRQKISFVPLSSVSSVDSLRKAVQWARLWKQYQSFSLITRRFFNNLLRWDAKTYKTYNSSLLSVFRGRDVANIVAYLHCARRQNIPTEVYVFKLHKRYSCTQWINQLSLLFSLLKGCKISETQESKPRLITGDSGCYSGLLKRDWFACQLTWPKEREEKTQLNNNDIKRFQWWLIGSVRTLYTLVPF